MEGTCSECTIAYFEADEGLEAMKFMWKMLGVPKVYETWCRSEFAATPGRNLADCLSIIAEKNEAVMMDDFSHFSL